MGWGSAGRLPRGGRIEQAWAEGRQGRQDELCGAQGQSLSWESRGAGEVRVLH